MIIAQFRQSTAYAGARLDYSEGRFFVGQADRSISFEELVSVDRVGGLQWQNADMRRWFYQNRRAFEQPITARKIDPVSRGRSTALFGAVFVVIFGDHLIHLPAAVDPAGTMAVVIAGVMVASGLVEILAGFGIMRRVRVAAWALPASLVCQSAVLTVGAVVAPSSGNALVAAFCLFSTCWYFVSMRHCGGLYRANGLEAPAAMRAHGRLGR